MKKEYKSLSYFIALLTGITLITYLVVNWPTDQTLEFEMELGGVTWPVGTGFEEDVDGNIILTLNDSMNFLRGSWPAETKIYFEGNKIYGIEVFTNFSFADFDFFKGAKLALKYPNQNDVLQIVELGGEKEMDGLDLKGGCLVSFKNYVLLSASCPEYENVFFKRHVELPEIKEAPKKPKE